MYIDWPNIIGGIGVVLILAAYAALQSGRLRSDSRIFSLLNLLGAGGILVSLFFEFNLSAFLMETAWVIVSLYGLTRRRLS